nr:unnamed protein product [Callosobruchus analis]
MGLSTWMYWMSWFLQVYIYLLIIMITFLILLLVPVFGDQAVFAYSDTSLILCFFLIYNAALVALILTISALFSRGK